MSKKKYNVPKFPPRLIMPASFDECLSYGQRQMYMWKVIQELQNKVEELEQKVDELTPGL